MQDASSYGRYYWCVRIPQSPSADIEGTSTVSNSTDIYLYADTCQILPSGAVEFKRVTKDEQTGEQIEQISMAFAAGEWILVFAASTADGSALAVED